MSIVDAADADAVGLAHREVLGPVRPVATMVVVAGLIDPAMLVEVELTAWSAASCARIGVVKYQASTGSAAQSRPAGS